MPTKTCSKCHQSKDVEDFYRHPCTRDGRQSQCKDCYKGRDRRTDKSRPKVERWGPNLGRPLTNRERHLKYDLGIDVAFYYELLKKQGGRCAICKSKNPRTTHGHFCIDHCHRSRKIRGLLCNHCNYLLGHAGDDPDRLERAAEYVRLSRKARGGVRTRKH